MAILDVDGRLADLKEEARASSALRIIQSVPSPRAESFRQWLAEVGDERFEEIEHPEAAIERVRQAYRDCGYDEAWIEARLRNDLTRNELTDEWLARGTQEGREYAILTNEISQETFDIAIQQHKLVKLLPARANLRDHMTTFELALISLGRRPRPCSSAIAIARASTSSTAARTTPAAPPGALGARSRPATHRLQRRVR